MKKRLPFAQTFCCLLLGVIQVFAQPYAFPGAEGAGRNTRGGRGGAVYEVTNLNDSGPGSLRDAINKTGPRTIVFRISGTIQLKSQLNIKNPFLTIAGQTAPGDGICLRDHAVQISADQIILRHLRFRLGDVTATEEDAIWGRYRKNLIIDHCSASWSIDESMSFYGNDSTTIQWCLISESLYLSTHPKGAHGYGGIWGGTDVSFHHNLFAHHSSRNPRFDGSNALCINVDFRNNVIYNWGFNSGYGGEGGTINIVANYYKAGPATKSGVRYRIVEPSDGKGKWYIENNYVDGSPAITTNNWAGGVQGDFKAEAISRVYTPHPFVAITEQTAEAAFPLVLANAGATLAKRDAIDRRIVAEVLSGTATFDGHAYERIQKLADTSVVRGIIDSQKEVGGWPELASLEAPQDSDHDGMPDTWEAAHGLNPADAADRNAITAEGYTQLEVYLDDLTDPASAPVAQTLQVPTTFWLQQNFPNPFNQRTTISFSLPHPGLVQAVLYNIEGNRVRQLTAASYSAGWHQLAWDGTDQQARPVSSGLYFCRIRFGEQERMIKMQLIR